MKLKINLGAILRAALAIAAPIVAEKAAGAILKQAEKLARPKEG